MSGTALYTFYSMYTAIPNRLLILRARDKCFRKRVLVKSFF